MAPQEIQQQQPIQPRGHRPLDEVLCFKCGEKGHYANNCRLSVTAQRGRGATGGTRANQQNQGQAQQYTTQQQQQQYQQPQRIPTFGS